MQSNNFKKEIITLTIDDVAYGGKGVGRVNGIVHFVSGVIKGEKVQVTKTKEKNDIIFCKLHKILEASPLRIKPVCPYAIQVEESKLRTHLTCPGCAYQHIEYKEEVQIKNSQFKEALKRLGDFKNPNILPPIPAPKDLNYRNKITMNTEIEAGEVALGYYMENQVSILDIPECALAHKEINDLIIKKKSEKSFYHTLKNSKITVSFRHTENNGASFWRNEPNSKDSWLKEKTVLGDFSVPKGSFFQINPQCGDILISKVEEIIKEKKPKSIIDLFCGIGIFGIIAGLSGAKVIGIDIDKKAIEVAKYNAKVRGLDNCKFIAGDAAKVISRIFNDIPEDDSILIIDPPRTGLTRLAKSIITQYNFKTIIYISCATDTFCRDAKEICYTGYNLHSSQILDMFPRTAHFESINIFEK